MPALAFPARDAAADDVLASMLATVSVEADALGELARAVRDQPLGVNLTRAASAILVARGRVVLCGIGKSGIVARKIASTLASTGTPALFLHPAEAGHGDLGMITNDDVVLALSWSGETVELADIVNYTRRFDVPLIAMTANEQSALAVKADVRLTLPRVREACPHQLAPTSSATMQMVLGDALALALVRMRGFSVDDFRTLHPRGRLGASLLTVADLMSVGADMPQVGIDATVMDAAVEISSKRLGVTGVVDAQGILRGAFTDGDLRRSLTANALARPVAEHMSEHPVTASPRLLASEALLLMNDHNIMQLFICRDGRLLGVLHLHEILRANVA